MNQAAIASEAFHDPLSVSPYETAPELETHARTYGMDDDFRWEREWQDAFETRNDCPPEPQPCGTSDYYRWQAAASRLSHELGLTVSYAKRWRLLRPQETGRWLGFFASNLHRPGVTLYNSYNRTDHVLRVDRGLGDRADPHAWFACQRRQKPNVGLGVAALDYFFGVPPGTKDGPTQQFWALLGGASSVSSVTDQEYLWGVGRHSRLVRQWGELAHWFSAVSAPAGVQPLPVLASDGVDRNIDLGQVGGTDSRASHSFIRMKSIADAWPAFERFRAAFAAH
jgi:hypothetical protein